MDSRRPPVLRPVSTDGSAPEHAQSSGALGISWVIHRLLTIGRWLRPYVIEPTLWPVTLVVLAHVVVFIAPLMLLAWRDGIVSAWVVLTLSAALSLTSMAAEITSTRRPGLAWAVIITTWASSAAAAWAANLHQIF